MFAPKDFLMFRVQSASAGIVSWLCDLLLPILQRGQDSAMIFGIFEMCECHWMSGFRCQSATTPLNVILPNAIPTCQLAQWNFYDFGSWRRESERHLHLFLCGKEEARLCSVKPCGALEWSNPFVCQCHLSLRVHSPGWDLRHTWLGHVSTVWSVKLKYLQ